MTARLSHEDRAVAMAAVSRVLLYPDAELLDQLPLFREAAGRLPGSLRLPLLRLVDHLAASPLLALQADYVATFDLRRRNCLYLTYHLNGDTRRRGRALWRFTDVYRQRGCSVADGELADFLPALLELAAEATADDPVPFDLLVEHQPGIAVLRRSLEDDASPYADAVRALEAMLPRPSEAVLEAARRLEAEGPPSEQVGLDPFVGAGAPGDRP